jgi:hypothetical protein
MELGYLLINGHWGALGTHLHATWDILASAPTPSLNMPLHNKTFVALANIRKIGPLT